MSEEFTKFISIILVVAFLSLLPGVIKRDYLARKSERAGASVYYR